MAAPQEYYIRSETETEARGPFNLDQVTSLVDAGQVTLETLYYEAATEQWVAIGANPEVKAAVFPEKKKLTINKAQKIAMLNKETDSNPPITVNDMLAAAEGRTDDTKDKSDPAIAMGRSAKIGMWSGIVSLLLATTGEILPSVDVLMKFDIATIPSHPLVILGFMDIILALLLILGVAAVYPLVRFRAALGCGFICTMLYLSGVPGIQAPLLAVALGSAGLYLCTVFVSYLPIAIAAGLALVGMGGFAWFSLTT